MLLNTAGQARLCDFGVSAGISGTQNSVVGSPYWMAPEVISQCGYSLPADVWSLGITVIEMAEMLPPRAHLHPMKVLTRIAQVGVVCVHAV